jgi:hypothetical protein
MSVGPLVRLGLLAALCAPAPELFACAACFGAPDSSQTQGMNAAILTLLGIAALVVSVLAAGLWRVVRADNLE